MKKNSKKQLSPIPKSGGFSSYIIGLIAALLCLISLKESSFSIQPSNHSNYQTVSQEAEIEWQLLPKLLKNKQKKFVEANTNAPENPPDDDKHFSFRDQQAAQPHTVEKSKINLTPKIKGTEKSQKIIEAVKEEVSKISNPTINKTNNNKLEKQINMERKTPLESKKESPDSLSDKGFFSKENKERGKDKEKVPLITTLADIRKSTIINRSNSLDQKPKKRPKLSADLIHGPIMKSVTNAPRIGMIGIECRLHPYGVYVQKMMQSIEEQWNQLATGSIQYLQRDRLPNKITICFELDSSGNIANLRRIDSEGYSLAAELCRQAIASRVPFGEWTEKMINDFGNSDKITISFKYQ